MGAYLVSLTLDSPWAMTAAFCVVAFSLIRLAVWAFKQDVGGRHVGSILGWGDIGGCWSGFHRAGANQHGGIRRHEMGRTTSPGPFAFFVAGVAALGMNRGSRSSRRRRNRFRREAAKPQAVL